VFEMQGPTTSKVQEKQVMDNGINVVNDLHPAPSQTIIINYEFDPLEFDSPTCQVI